MKVVDLHPEELFDKLEAGSLTEAERARLDAHVARCDACRLEMQLRADFAGELGDDAEDSRFPSHYLVEIIAGAEKAAAEPPAPAPEPPAPAETDEERVVALPRRSTLRRTRLVWLVAAAAVAVVGVAGASETSGGRWIRHVVGVDATESESAPPEVKAPTPAKTTATSLHAPTAEPAPAPAPEPEPESVAAPEPVALVAAAPVVKAPVAVAKVPVVAPAPVPTDRGRWAAAAEPEGAAALLEEASVARRRGDYGRAITLARRLHAGYPETREAHLSQATLGRLLLDTGDAAGALASFDAYLSKRGGELDEPVMVGRAIALDRLGRAADGKQAWSALLDAFPSSPYAEHARSRAGGAVSPAR